LRAGRISYHFFLIISEESCHGFNIDLSHSAYAPVCTVLLPAAGSIGGSSDAVTFVVTNSNDSGTGSLRKAIQNANAHVGADVITFNITTGFEPHIIQPLTNLPTITDPVAIRGGLANNIGGPAVVLDGLLDTSVSGQGLVITDDLGILAAHLYQSA
jgi:hypothetical protein